MKAILILALFTLHHANTNTMQQFEQLERNRRLHEAAIWGNYGTIKVLIAFGADVNFRKEPEISRTSLHAAASNGHAKVCSYLIDKGADLNATDATGNTPLMLAVKNHESKAYKVLLKAGADTTPVNNKRKTALMIAEEYNNQAAVEAIRQKFE